MQIMGKFRIQRLFAIALGIISVVASWIIPVDSSIVLISCFMVFWGLDGWVRE